MKILTVHIKMKVIKKMICNKMQMVSKKREKHLIVYEPEKITLIK